MTTTEITNKTITAADGREYTIDYEDTSAGRIYRLTGKRGAEWFLISYIDRKDIFHAVNLARAATHNDLGDFMFIESELALRPTL